MNTHRESPDRGPADALAAPDSTVRLRAALEIGTAADPGFARTLVDRCALEPDFFVRDMLTWSLCRLPAQLTVPLLLAELDSGNRQARSQALHTLSKIGDPRAWPAVSGMVHDQHDEVARSAWRAAVALVPAGSERRLAAALGAELGRGDHDLQLSLARALAALDDAAVPVLEAALADPDPRVRAHARATERIRVDPDSAFALSLETATRVAVTGTDGKRG
ncbi:HEAT repeat domain-containing protein [Rhodococcus sp. NPDC047139]|uniref:HEAT repeat domain-containing protein n=1 Tax=Rhodococcus sp. NPDC047139 TaxID=3155141 RepID=UPI0033CE238F